MTALKSAYFDVTDWIENVFPIEYFLCLVFGVAALYFLNLPLLIVVSALFFLIVGAGFRVSENPVETGADLVDTFFKYFSFALPLMVAALCLLYLFIISWFGSVSGFISYIL